jgi:hypothetical protein
MTCVLYLSVVDDVCLLQLLPELDDSIGVGLADEVALDETLPLHKVQS